MSQQTIKDLVKDFRLNSKIKDFSYIFTSNIADEFHYEFKRQLREESLQGKLYIYMLTFTIDPKKHPEITPEITDVIDDLIKSQASRTALKIKNYSYVKEFHKDGRPHWHALIVTYKALAKDRFNYYISKYGNIDISKNNSQQTDEIVNYMSKSAEIVTLK